MQHPVKLRTCRFYMGELLMSALALSAAMYGMAAVNRWSFSVFLTLQGKPLLHIISPCEALAPI